MWMEADELMHRNTHLKRASHKETLVVKEVGYVPVMIPCSLEHLPKEKFDIKWGSAVTIFLEEKLEKVEVEKCTLWLLRHW